MKYLPWNYPSNIVEGRRTSVLLMRNKNDIRMAARKQSQVTSRNYTVHQIPLLTVKQHFTFFSHCKVFRNSRKQINLKIEFVSLQKEQYSFSVFHHFSYPQTECLHSKTTAIRQKYVTSKIKHSHILHNGASVNSGLHIPQRSHKIISPTNVAAILVCVSTCIWCSCNDKNT